MVDSSQGRYDNICASCGAEQIRSGKFCGNCGAPRLNIDSSSNIIEDSSVNETEEVIFQFESPKRASRASADSVPPKSSAKPAIWVSVLAVTLIGVAIAANQNSNTTSTSNYSEAVAQNEATPTPTQTVSTSKPSPSVSKKSNIPTAKATPSNQCVLSDKVHSDLLKFRKTVITVVTGKNDASNRQNILNWANQAETVSNLLYEDSSLVNKNLSTRFSNASSDLSDLAIFVNDWANSQIQDPENFATDYSNGILKIQNDYLAIFKSCAGKIPSF